jgi:hypothetical protein
MILMRAMAHIEPEHVDAGVKERAELVRRRAGRPDSCYDFGFAVTHRT